MASVNFDTQLYGSRPQSSGSRDFAGEPVPPTSRNRPGGPPLTRPRLSAGECSATIKGT